MSESVNSLAKRLANSGIMPAMKYLEIRRQQAFRCQLDVGLVQRRYHDGWHGIVDGHKGNGKRYIVESDELLRALVELEATLL